MKSMEMQARYLATRYHLGQNRKYTGDPYIVHPAAVVELVRSVPHTDAMLCAAWLHDVVEDTQCTITEIDAVFGAEVAELVEMLTDVSKPSDGNRAIRKGLDLQHTAKSNAQAKTIKLADLIDNTASIVEHDKGFAKIYLAEKALLLEVLRRGDRTLWNVAYAMLLNSETKLREELK